VRAIYSYLSFQEGRQRSGDTIQTMLWPLNASDRDVSKKTLTNYMSNARALVGVEHLPEAKGQRGYELLRYTTDWIEFQRHVAEAADSPDDIAYKLHHDALALIRGSLFEGEESSYFDFVRDEGYERVIQNAVSKVAHEHFREAMLNGDLDEAEWAARQGLKIDPRDTMLWADLTDVIARRGNDPELERHFAHAEGALGPDAAQQLRDRLHA
jgi:DNA-binding SARP family transcriptional activator